MGQVISFTGYTPAGRFDAVPWTDARVEEASESTGPWTLIDTLPLIPVDADPTHPATRNLTSDEGSPLPNLWYRLTFVDGNGDTAQPSQPIQNTEQIAVVAAPYVTLEEFKTYFGIKSNVDDDRILIALAAATEAINVECDRDFHAVSETGADTERFYTPDRPRTLEIDDVLEIHEFASDLAGNGSFDLIWVENRDFTLQPLNAAAKGRPYERVKIHPWSHFVLSSLPRSVRITGVFGWATVPNAVTQATLTLANRLRLRKDTPYGVASFGSEVAMRLLKTDPDLQLLLNDLSRDTVIY